MSLDNAVKHICIPLDHCKIDGPNGSHICLACPVLGSQVSSILQEFDDPDRSLRPIALQAVQAMATLHEHGICHGDYTPSNILRQLSGFDGLSEEELIQALGLPRQNKVTNQAGEAPTEPTAPQYLVYPVDFNSIDSRCVTDQACVIDFGASFEVAKPTEDLGIPQICRSPELILEKFVGISRIVMLLGKLPEPWWTTWEDRKAYFEGNVDADGWAVPRFEITESTANVTYPKECRSLREKLSEDLWCMPEWPASDVKRDSPGDEIELFADLLSKLLKYKPEEQLSAKAALDHEWFKM